MDPKKKLAFWEPVFIGIWVLHILAAIYILTYNYFMWLVFLAWGVIVYKWTYTYLFYLKLKIKEQEEGEE